MDFSNQTFSTRLAQLFAIIVIFSSTAFAQVVQEIRHFVSFGFGAANP